MRPRRIPIERGVEFGYVKLSRGPGSYAAIVTVIRVHTRLA